MEAKVEKRREFLLKLGALISGLFIFKSVRANLKVDSVKKEKDQNLIMLDDLKRALSKSVAERKWAMVIDVMKCIGCKACVVACIAENNLPPGVTFRWVFEVEDGEYPDVRRFFMPTNCMQCDNAPCIEAVNKIAPSALYKRPDGIVAVDYEKFKDKKVFEAAKEACPFHALYWDESKFYTEGTPGIMPYEKRRVKEFGKEIKKGERVPFGRKCHFCLHRIEVGLLPACVSTCTGGAMYFGDLNDPESLVSKLVKERKGYKLEEQIKPRVLYLYGNEDAQESCSICHG